jgi:hypothetical protein
VTEQTEQAAPESAPEGPTPKAARRGPRVIDLIPDELALARAQLNSGLTGVAEAVLRRHAARLALQGPGALEDLDETHALLAEALWRQQRPLQAGAIAEQIRTSGMVRRRPTVMIIEAEAEAAAGHGDRAAALMEQVLASVGTDEAWRLRAGIPSRLPWPLPPSMRPDARRVARPAFPPPEEVQPQRSAGAHARLEAARGRYAAGQTADGDAELALALRLDPGVAIEGIDLLEPMLGEQPAAGRLVLYGDLLRAAGRTTDAAAAYDRAARSET